MGLSSFTEKLFKNLTRAQSARSEKVESLSKQRLDWDDKLDSHKVSMELDKLSVETKGINLRLHSEHVSKNKNKELRMVQSECRKRGSDALSRFSRNSDSVKSER